MNQRIKTILMVLVLTIVNFSTAQATIVSYDIEGVLYEPMTQPKNTIFTGTFDWDADTDTLFNLNGVMNSSMYSLVQDISLTNHLATSIDQNGIVTASVFKDNTTDVFKDGGYNKGDYYTNGLENAYFSFSFDKVTMVGDVNSIVYADCTPLGMMGEFCMTGSSLGGTMNAVPYTLTISEVSSVPVPAAVWLFVSALVGLAGVSRKRVIPV